MMTDFSVDGLCGKDCWTEFFVPKNSVNCCVTLVSSPDCNVTGFSNHFCFCRTVVCQEFDFSDDPVVASVPIVVVLVEVEVERTVVAVVAAVDPFPFGPDRCFLAKMVFG